MTKYWLITSDSIGLYVQTYDSMKQATDLEGVQKSNKPISITIRNNETRTEDKTKVRK